jgi:hypothetical protein
MVNTSANVVWHADGVDPVVGRPADPERVALADYLTDQTVHLADLFLRQRTSPIRCISLVFSPKRRA